MTKTANPPSKPNVKTSKPRKPRRAFRIEDNPAVQAWCDDFVKYTEDEHGYTPTADQVTTAFLMAALRAIGKGAE